MELEIKDINNAGFFGIEAEGIYNTFKSLIELGRYKNDREFLLEKLKETRIRHAD